MKESPSLVADYRRLAGFFVPMALQTVSQSLTYPLVSMVAARGPGGTLDMAGLAQSNSMIAFLWALGAGMLTAGMVYGKSHEGFRRYVRINGLVTLGVALVYLVLMVPLVAHAIFGVLLGLPPSIEAPARRAFIWSLPMVVLFYLRNPYHAVLFNGGHAGLAFGATVGRILVTVALAWLCCTVGWTGTVWAVACMTVAVLTELGLLRLYVARRVSTPSCCGEKACRASEVVLFAFTLSVGLMFLSLSGALVGAFIARAPRPEWTLPVYFLAWGVANTLAAGGTRVQSLVLVFSDGSPASIRRLWRFSLGAGVVMGLLPLLLIVPGAAECYYVRLQNLDPQLMSMVRETAWLLAPMPFATVVRSYCEGRAAHSRKPVAVLAGQAIYLAMVAVASFFAVNAGIPGHWIGPLALLVANLAAAGVVHLAVAWEDSKRSAAPEVAAAPYLR
jgi:hypothetical protein